MKMQLPSYLKSITWKNGLMNFGWEKQARTQIEEKLKEMRIMDFSTKILKIKMRHVTCWVIIAQ